MKSKKLENLFKGIKEKCPMKECECYLEYNGCNSNFYVMCQKYEELLEEKKENSDDNYFNTERFK